MVKGLSSKEAQFRIAKYGQNKIRENKRVFLKKTVAMVSSPISLMLLAATLLSYLSHKTFDVYIIFFLFLFNIAIGLWHEWKTDSAVKKLNEKLAINVRVLRDGVWQNVESSLIVPDDIVKLVVGDLVPADMEIIEAENISINESVLTGESFPKEKKKGGKAFSGSFVSTGKMIGKVIATGENTYFGKTISLVEKADKRSELEKDTIRIARFLIIISLISVAILTAFFVIVRYPIQELLTLDLSLLIAGIPIALPTVMTLIISIGTLELAKRHVIIRRLASLEDLANVNLLLTDKTGTLTENEIIVAKIISYGDYSEKDVVIYAVHTALNPGRSPINQAIIAKSKKFGLVKGGNPIKLIPADSKRKHATAIIHEDGETVTIAAGASQVILSLAKTTEAERKIFKDDVEQAAEKGFMSIAVALGPSEAKGSMTLIGILLLTSPLNSDAKDIIAFLGEQGIGVKILTGDNIAITRRVVSELGLKGEVYTRDKMEYALANSDTLAQTVAFAEVLPKDKYMLVEQEKKDHIVAVTGDGINDIAAIKAADVGIAVKNAVDALKGAADIVLLLPGLAVIRDALVESRKIFARLYSYSVYRISESFRLIITVLIIGLAYRSYPLIPIQLILLAFLNDVPIVTLAFDRVKAMSNPAKINVRERFSLSALFGLTGVANSLILFFFALNVLHLPLPIVQTMFFLKLTVSGHMLIYVAHTNERWFRFLPSKQVILATFTTQIIASLLAFFGILMPSISLGFIIFIWIWSFFWMQITEVMKIVQAKLIPKLGWKS